MISLSKPLIICIVGPSGSGKTTLAKALSSALEIPTLVSYTTRPMRDNETNGVDHWFVKEKDMPSQSQMLAYTLFGGFHYWMPLAEIPAYGACIYVIDEKGVVFLKEKYGDDFLIYPVLVKRERNELVAQVGKDRVERDRDRLQIPEEEYSLVLINNGTLDDFINNSVNTFKNIFE